MMLPSEFLATRNLCKGHYYEKDGQIDHEHEHADACCVEGAAIATIPDPFKRSKFMCELDSVLADPQVFASRWNDRPETTKEMALAVLRETEKRLGL